MNRNSARTTDLRFSPGTDKTPVSPSDFYGAYRLQPGSFHQFLTTTTRRSPARVAREAALTSHINALRNHLEKNGISCVNIHGRLKSAYATWRKLHKYGMAPKPIFDLVAVRLIVADIDSCYHALAVIHERFEPIRDRVKDYIAHPKSNGYKSLHTSVNSNLGPFEIQIRTRQMHQVAEFGSAAHWLYVQRKNLHA